VHLIRASIDITVRTLVSRNVISADERLEQLSQLAHSRELKFTLRHYALINEAVCILNEVEERLADASEEELHL